MYKHILIATDGSEIATKGVAHGLELAKSIGAKVTIVTVSEHWSALGMAHAVRSGVNNPVQVFDEAAREEAATILGAAAELAEGTGLAVETLHIPENYPADGIIKAAEDKGCDLIVMASHGRRGASRLLLGSQASEVVALASVPVLVVR